MKKIKQINVLVIAVLIGIISSCSTSNSVVTNGLFAKRKYNDGYHYNGRSVIKAGDSDEYAEVKKERKTNEVVLTDLNETKSITHDDSKTDITAATEGVIVSDIVSDENVVATNTVNITTANNSLKESVNVKENVNSTKEITKAKIKKIARKESNKSDDAILYILLCILIPFVAVGLATDWDVTKVLICLLLSFLFWIPGIIYAFIVCKKEGAI